MNTVEKRNGTIDILRIVFALIVVAFHFFSDGVGKDSRFFPACIETRYVLIEF